jgi:5-dehydro-2-deoxygluconokinase
MKEIHNAGIEPDIWKVEGIETAEDCRKVSALARSGADREDVGIIVLGRGEGAEKVKAWLTVAAQVPGLIGFAVGRTVFWEPVVAFKEGKITRAEAVARIADSFGDLCKHWMAAKNRA